MQNAPPEAAVVRFRSDLIRLTGGAGPFGVAVSGGPDSLALLLLCTESFPGKTHAATVDHGLRPEGTTEAGFVALLCQSMGVPHSVLSLTTMPEGNVQDWARRERYAALDQWAAERNLTAILTGHHADDQRETVVMRLNRGSGVAGLSGVREQQGKIVRPLLLWRQSELEALVDNAGLTPVRDPSNIDDKFDRARLRKALDGAEWLDPLATARSARALADAEDALNWAAQAAFVNRCVVSSERVTIDWLGLPTEIVRRVLIASLRSINPVANPRGEDVERLIIALRAGGVATLAGVRCAGGTLWCLTLAPPHRKN